MIILANGTLGEWETSIRMVFDPNERLEKYFKIFDDQATTLHLTAELLELSPTFR